MKAQIVELGACLIAGALALLGTRSAKAADPPPAALLTYCFEDGSGTTTSDSSGHGHTGTLGSAVTRVAGHTGKGLQFDAAQGANSVATFGPNDTFDTLTQGSVAFWFNNPTGLATDNTAYPIFFAGSNDCYTGTSWNLALLNDSSLEGGFGTYVQVEGFTNGTLDFYAYAYLGTGDWTNWHGWHHYVWVSNADGVALYVDGASQTLIFDPGSSATPSFLGEYAGAPTVYSLGSDPCPNAASGILDEFHIYDTALPPAQVTTVMNDPSPCPPVCVGDCAGNLRVTVNEILIMVNLALGNTGALSCAAGDANADGQIRVNEILAAVNNVLNGCPRAPS